VFAGKYTIERLLGTGGMGVVLAAKQIESGQRVALKVLLDEHTSDRATLSRFLREGRAMLQLTSPAVARVIEVGDGDRPYIAMEYLEGSDLQKVMNDRGQIGYREAVDLVLEACDGIAEAHANAIVHRDLKPSNLFLSSSGMKVLDFGISKIGSLEAGTMTMTKTASVMGSPLYMSPEQLRSAKHLDHRADIWALGVILYELVRGTPPFVASTIAELGALVLSGRTPWLGDVVPATPAGLSAVIATCLQQKASDRFVDLADFADRLAPFGTERARAAAANIVKRLGMPAARATLAERPARDEEPTVGLATTVMSETTVRGNRGISRLALVGVALGVVAGVGFVAWRFAAWSPPPKVAATEPPTASVPVEVAPPSPVESTAPTPPRAPAATSLKLQPAAAKKTPPVAPVVTRAPAPVKTESPSGMAKSPKE
jgi:serine/threonine-protein kinase